MEISRGPELTEGTWLQLMCCAPSRLRCPKFQSNGDHGHRRRRRRQEVHEDGCAIVDIQTGPIIHDLFVYVSMGMYVSTKEKDNKMVMEHKKHDNLKQKIMRILEFQIGDKSENREQLD